MRPITVMAAVAVVVIVLGAVFAWTRDDESTVVGQPASLPILLGSRSATAMAVTSTVVNPVSYVRGRDVADLTGTLDAWTVAATEPDPAGVRRLADAFDVSGDLHRSADGWQIGADDGAFVRVASSAGARWIYNAGLEASTAAVCGVPPAPPTTVPVTTIPGQADAVPDPCAPTSPPANVPSTTEAERRARDLLKRAGLELGSFQITSTSDDWGAQVTATPEIGGVAGHGVETVVSFGAEASVTAAVGWLGSPTKMDTYPLVGVDAAIARLNHGQDPLLLDELTPQIASGPVSGPGSGSGSGSVSGSVSGSAPGHPTTTPTSGIAASRDTIVPQDAPDTSVTCAVPLGPAEGTGGGPATTTTVVGVGDGDAGGSGSSGPSCPDSICPVPPCPPDAQCAAPSCGPSTCDPAACPDPFPGPTVVPDPTDPSVPSDLPQPTDPGATTITITSVELVLAAVPGTDGALWLVPAYRFGTEDAATLTVLAIDDSFIATGSTGSTGSTGIDGPPTTGTEIAPTCTAPWMCTPCPPTVTEAGDLWACATDSTTVTDEPPTTGTTRPAPAVGG